MKKSHKINWSAAGLSMVVAGGAVIAFQPQATAQPPRGDGHRGPGMFMEKADTNNDGGVSLEELQAIRPNATAEEFAKRDSNGDGLINREDAPEGMKGRRGPRGEDGKGFGPEGRPGHGPKGFAPKGPHGDFGPGMFMEKADTNGDGGVSLEELQAYTVVHFAERDTNGDGVLNREDFPEGPEGRRGEGREGHGPEGRRGPGGEGREGHGPEGRRGPGGEGREGHGPEGRRGPDGDGPRGERGDRGPGKMMENADTDGDGGVSLEEMKAVRPEITADRFAEMDRNGDGLLNREDRPRHRGNGPEN